MEKKYDLILQNNASKEFIVFSALTDYTTTHLYYKFVEDLELKEGEYTYAVVPNDDETVIEYDFKNPLLDTVLKIDEKTVILKDMEPDTGLMRVGKDIKEDAIYDPKNNNEIFYYE